MKYDQRALQIAMDAFTYGAGPEDFIEIYLKETGSVMVPMAALAWLNGEADDADGFPFGDNPKDQLDRINHRYWWRSRFRKMINGSQEGV